MQPVAADREPPHVLVVPAAPHLMMVSPRPGSSPGSKYRGRTTASVRVEMRAPTLPPPVGPAMRTVESRNGPPPAT